MKIRGKFTLAFVSVFALVAVGSAVTLWMNHQVEDQVQEMLHEHRVKYDLAKQIQYEGAVRAEAQRNLVIMTDPAALEKERQSMRDSAARYGERMDQLMALPLSAQEAEMVNAIRANGGETYNALGEFLGNLDADMKEEAVEVLYGSMRSIQSRFFGLVDEFTALQEKELRDAEASLESSMRFANLLQLILATVMAVMVSLIGWLLTHSIATPIVQLTERMRQVAASTEFNRPLDLGRRNDEIGDSVRAFNLLIAEVGQSLTQVQQVMQALAGGDFKQRVEASLKGDLQILKDAVNDSSAAIDASMSELGRVLDALRAGQFDVQVSSGRFGGSYAHLLSQAGATAQGLHDVVACVNSTMQAMAKGDFSRRVQAAAQGDLAVLRSNINQTAEDLCAAMSELQQVAQGLAAGRLSVRMQGSYAGELQVIAQAMNAGLDKVHQSLRDIASAASVVGQASAEVSEGNRDFSDRTQQQAAGLQEAAAAMTHVVQLLERNSEQAIKTRRLAADTRQAAESGVTMMDQTVNAMHDIRDANQRITGIVALIDSIAFQTNLLALNAAVEAARAGEHGRGFAVVAGEVRTLAQKSADAARDIKSVIEQSVTKIASGDALVEQTVTAFKAIESRLVQTDAAIAAIADGMQEQRAGVADISHTISEMDTRVQQNAALVEEVSATAETLRAQSEDMLARVGVFELGNTAKAVAASSRSVAALPAPADEDRSG